MGENSKLSQIAKENGAFESYPNGIHFGGGVADHYIDMEKICSTPKGRAYIKEEFRENVYKMILQGANIITIPEEVVIRAPTLGEIARELSEELNMAYSVLPVEKHIAPSLVGRFYSQLLSEEIYSINNDLFEIHRMDIQPGEVIPPHRYKTFTQLVHIIGGRHKRKGKLYGFGHKFMINKGEVYEYDNSDFDVPLHILSIGIPKFTEGDIEFI